MRLERELPAARPTFESVCETACEQLLLHGFHPPMVIVVGTQQAVGLELSEMAETLEQRQEQLFSAGFTLATHERIGELEDVFFVSEAWARRFAVVETEPPTDKKSKVEVLMVLGLHVPNADLQWELYEMRRDKTGALIEARHYLGNQMTNFKVNDHLVTAFVSGYSQGIEGTI